MEPVRGPVGRDITAMPPNRTYFHAAQRLPDILPPANVAFCDHDDLWREDKLQQQMLSNIEKVSPEALMQSWFTFDPKIAERFQDMFVTMAGLGGMGQKGKK